MYDHQTLTLRSDICRKIVNTVSAPAAIGPYNQVLQGIFPCLTSLMSYAAKNIPFPYESIPNPTCLEKLSSVKKFLLVRPVSVTLPLLIIFESHNFTDHLSMNICLPSVFDKCSERSIKKIENRIFKWSC